MAYGPARFCVLLLLVGTLPALAQNVPTQTINKLAEGVRFDLPAAWSLDRRPFRGPGNATGLLRAGSINGRQALQVFVFEGAAADDFDVWFENFSLALKTISGFVEAREATPPPIARPAKLLLVRAELPPDQIDTSYVCVRLDVDRVLCFAFSQAMVGQNATPFGVVPESVPAVLRTLQVTYSAEWARELPFARRRGLKFLKENLAQAIRSVRLDPDPRVYLLEEGGKPLGYRIVHYRPERHSVEDPQYGNTRGEPGLRVSEQEWRFANPHASFEAWDSFSSVSAKTGLYEHTRSETVQVGGVFTAPLVTRDECVRATDQLVSSYTTSMQVALPDPERPLPLGRDFLGLGWARVLPAMVPAEQSEWVTVMSYHPGARELAPFSIRRVGTSEREGETLLEFEYRWGYEPRVQLTTDAYGNPLVWKQGGLRYVRSTQEEVDRRFAAQLEAARPRLSNVKQGE